MKTFITLLVLVALGFGAWELWGTNKNAVDVAYQSSDTASASVSPYVTDYPSITQTPVATSQASATTTPRATPRKTATPAPGIGGTGTPPPRAPIFTNLTSRNDSGESGVVALTANRNDLATFDFNMNGFPVGISQKVGILNGTCDRLSTVAWWLEPLMNGTSMSILQNDYLEIAQSKNRYAIVVYGPNNSDLVYACGQLR